MTKSEYLQFLTNRINEILNDFNFNRFSKQLLAEKLNSDFEKSYSIDYLWNRVLVLLSGCCFLLENEDSNCKIAMKGLKEVAFVLENMSEIDELRKVFDVEYLKVLSALCYDIAGYQANAFCLVSDVEKTYSLENELINLEEDNFIIGQILLIIKKNIPYAKAKLLSYSREKKMSLLFIKVKDALLSWYEEILNLEESDYKNKIFEAYSCCLKSGNIYLSEITLLLKVKFIEYSKRSIFHLLKLKFSENLTWRKYVKLLSNDYYEKNKIKKIEDRKSIYEFWVSQIAAIKSGVLDITQSYIVQMPTSAGKTFIAELFILNHLLCSKKKVVYISPFNALSTEKESELNSHFSKLGIVVSSLQGSYETNFIDQLVFNETDVLVITPEKADLLLRMQPDFFKNVSAIVIDEGHIIGDLNSRSSILEFLIIQIKKDYPEIKLLFISAVMRKEDANLYARWIGHNENNVLRSESFFEEGIDWEPTRKYIGKFFWNDEVDTGKVVFSNVKIFDTETNNNYSAYLSNYLKNREFPNQRFQLKKSKARTTVSLAIKLAETGNTLIFCGQERIIKSVANTFEYFFERNIGNEKFPLRCDTDSYRMAVIWYGENHYISKAIARGIGVHFGLLIDQVKEAVEKDYHNKVLKLLLATNTISQGVNFPIKNLIIHNLSYGYSDHQLLIPNRDFWNLIGRVGRAEKETEGIIIYVSTSSPDEDNYEKLLDEKNIEKADSLIFKELFAYNQEEINEESFEKDISILSETYLLKLLSVDDPQEEINRIINYSLFKHNSEENSISLEPVKNSFKKIWKRIEDENQHENISSFVLTGLLFDTNKEISQFISEKEEKFRDVTSIWDFISLFLTLCEEKKIDELDLDYRIEKLTNQNWKDYQPVIESWISGNEIEIVKEKWIENVSPSEDEFYLFLGAGLKYLFPWLISGMIQICKARNIINDSNLIEKIEMIPTFFKYGLYSKNSCIAMKYGINSRSVALKLDIQGTGITETSFLSWLVNLNQTQIEELDVPDSDKENVIEVINSLGRKSMRDVDSSVSFEIKGITYFEEAKIVSREMRRGIKLSLQRDPKNNFDPYAIKLFYGDFFLGFIPREYTQYLATEIDLLNQQYQCYVTMTREENEGEYKRVWCYLKKI